jgi:hypothetical protein
MPCEPSGAASASGLVMLCWPLALVSGIKEAEPHRASGLVNLRQLLYSRIVKDLDFKYLKAACHPPPNSLSAAGEMESGLRSYEGRALSISAPSNEHNASGCQ